MEEVRGPQDPQATASLVKSLAEVTRLRAHYHALVQADFSSASAAATDAEHPIGLLVWVLATQSWAVASDHAMAWYELLTKAQAQPMRAHGTLLRGVIESAVTCRYLVDPAADQPERRRRAAALQLDDYRERANFERSSGIDKRRLNRPAKHATERTADFIGAMKSLGVAKIDQPKMTTLCARYSAGAWLYQLLSAFAHGKPWALLGSELSDITVPLPPGTRGGYVTARDDLSVLGTMYAMEALAQALDELDSYRRDPADTDLRR
jgi:hypothetical protein